MERIPVSGPSITAHEIAYVTDAVTNSWFANANVFHERFESAFAKYHGRAFAVALPSCTSAIHLSLLAYGVGPGDEVVVPECTWIASAAPIHYVGAHPVCADIDAKTWCMSAASFEACITPRTRAVIPVDLYGGMPDLAAIKRIAAGRGIHVIEDAAEAAGSRFQGKPAGSWGDTGVFSFHGSKTMTTYEGGMLITDDAKIHGRVLTLRDHGRKPGDRMFFNEEVGYKYKMSSMQAALGLAQIERLEELVARKREIFSWYREGLAGIPGLTLNSEDAQTRNSYWMVTAILAPERGLRKEQLMARFSAHNIDTRPFFHPLSSLPAYRDCASVQRRRQDNVVSMAVSPYGINLPSGLTLTASQVARVVEVFRTILDDSRR